MVRDIKSLTGPDYGGYMRRLRRLYEEEENARDRSVPDGSDKDLLTRFQ